MSKLIVIIDCVLECVLDLVYSVGDGLKSVGGSLCYFGLQVSDWIKIGVVLGVVKIGGKVVIKFVWCNLVVIIVVVVVGVGLFGYVLYCKQQKKKVVNGYVVNGQVQCINVCDCCNDIVVDEYSDIGSDV